MIVMIRKVVVMMMMMCVYDDDYGCEVGSDDNDGILMKVVAMMSKSIAFLRGTNSKNK